MQRPRSHNAKAVPRRWAVLRRDALVFLLLAGLTAACKGDLVASHWSQPQWEDALFFGHVDARLHTVRDLLLEGSFWEGLYRPLSTNLVYWLDCQYFDRDVRFLHALALLLYVANAWLLYLLGARLADWRAAALAAALWVTRSAGNEVILYGSQVQSSLPTAFTLLALCGALSPGRLRKRHLVWVLACTFGALASKESAVTIFAIIAALRLTVDRRAWAEEPSAFRRLAAVSEFAAPTLGATLLWLLWAKQRLIISHSPHWSYDFRPQSLLAGAAFYAGSFFNFAVGAPELVDPCVTQKALPALSATAHETSTAVFLASLMALAVLVLVTVPGGRRAAAPLRFASFGTVWFLLALGPTLPLHDRWLLYYGYPGHAGLALAAACLLIWALDHARRDVRAPALVESDLRASTAD